LPIWYDHATPEDQAALELNCVALLAESARRERAQRVCLVEWIGAAR
jgi:TorA maturation chaperone TorD